MTVKFFRVFVLVIFILSLGIQSVSTNSFAAPLNQQTSFSHPLGYYTGENYVPRLTNDNNGNLIENTDYGVKNPDLDNPNTCFGVDWRELFHAGEDLYYPDRGVNTAGHDVTAIADGTVLEVTPPGWPGQGIIIEHTLSSGQKVYSVYLHVDDVQVVEGPVSEGDLLGTVIQQDYAGLFPDYHVGVADSHLHFEIRYFADARGIYEPDYPNCEGGYGIGRGYTLIHPDDFPAPGAGYTDPTDFINSHQPAPTETPTPTPTPTGTPIEQGTLPSQINGGPGIVTISNLILGMQYRIVVSGVVNYRVNNPIWVDPQWSDYQADPNCFCRYGGHVSFNGVTLAAENGQTVFDPDHTYTFLWVADSTQLQMHIADSYYSDNSGSFDYQIYEGPLVGTPGPSPTPSVTPQPTTCVKTCFWENCTSANQWIGSKVARLNHGINFVINNFDRIADQAALLYRVRDEVLSTSEEGQRYIDLYYTHSPEIAAIMDTHPDLAEQGLDVIDLLSPNLQALVEGHGSSATITSDQIQQAQDFLDAFFPYASLELQQAIIGEQGRRPLEQLGGLTMDEAWAYLSGYQLMMLQPVSDPDPYIGQIGRTIPLRLTLTDIQGDFVTDPSVTLELVNVSGDVVIGPIGLSGNPARGIITQGEKYHYNLDTKGLEEGEYTLRVYYNAIEPGEPSIWVIWLVSGEK